MEAISARLRQLDEEIGILGNEIKAAKADLKAAAPDDKQMFKDMYKDLVAKEKTLLASRAKLEDQLSAAAAGAGSGAGAVLAGPDVTKFWSELGRSTEDSGFLVLPSGCSFLGNDKLGSALLIRKSYKDLLQIVMQQMSLGVTKVIITGSSGIGKSYFLFYLLHSLAQQQPMPPATVFQTRTSCFCLLSNGTVLEGSLSHFREYLRNPDCWYLVDGIEPASRAAKTVLVSSPNRQIYHQFRKEPGATQRYMPVWSFEEIEACWKRLYSGLQETEMVHLFDIWGGRPRYVLEKACDASAQRLLQEAISSCNLEQVITSLGEVDRGPEASDRLVTIMVDPDYITTKVFFASDSIANMWADKRLEVNKAEVQNLLRASEGEGLLAPLWGVFYENVAHQKLVQGGRFPLRDLSTSNKSKRRILVLKQQAGLRFDKLSEVAAVHDKVYCWPKRRNLESVDSVQQPNSLFQMTCSSTHPVKATGLEAAIKVLKGSLDQEVELYFIVPPKIFADFKLQAIEQPKAPKVPILLSRPVRQFVVQVAYKAGALSRHRGVSAVGIF